MPGQKPYACAQPLMTQRQAQVEKTKLETFLTTFKQDKGEAAAVGETEVLESAAGVEIELKLTTDEISPMPHDSKEKRTSV